MDECEKSRLLLRHSIRCAVGGAVISAIALGTPATTGCTTSVLFFISTLAGTPENYQGFQMRSTSLAFLGALLGGLAFLLVALVATASKIGTFFAAAPLVALFSALRAEKALMPMPAVANVYLGFLLIARFGDPRSTLGRHLVAFYCEAAIAWAIAMAVNLFVLPDRAGDLGRRIVAAQLRTVGAIISKAGTKTFSNRHSAALRVDPHQSKPNENFTDFMADGLLANAVKSGLFADDYLFETANLPRRRRRPDTGGELSGDMLRAARETLRFLQKLRPFGHTRSDDYRRLARARTLFAASAFEPRLLPEPASRWRNAAVWGTVLDSMESLVSKASSLESVSCSSAGAARFSRPAMIEFFGEAYFPLWETHFASCAAACAVMASAMRHATCEHMFRLSSLGDEGGDVAIQVQGSGKELHDTIDPRRWHKRRWDMYFGILIRYRDGLRNSAVAAGSDSWHGIETPEPGQEQMQSADLDEQTGLNMSDRQALAFFTVASQALAEEIQRVQKSMTLLAESSHSRGWLSPFRFLVSGIPSLWRRLKVIFTGKMEQWEMQFAFAHSLLLLTILALALFLPLTDIFEASEFAWIFTSAALAAQLSAEPTVFICAIRVIATVTGAILSFGFNSFLNAVGRKSNPAVQYAIIPYIFFVTITLLKVMPPSMRYAAFLVVVTNAVLLFCPRATADCSELLQKQTIDCLPDWQYTVSRAANVSIGVIFALVFHLVFWPRFASDVAKRDLSSAFLSSSRLFRKMHRTYFAYGLDKGEKRSSSLPQDDSTKAGIAQRQESLLHSDVYEREESILKEIRKKVRKRVVSAMLTVQAEASVWSIGPLRLSPLIGDLLTDFQALNVSLSEMAVILGRRPIFSGEYGRSAYEHFIKPTLSLYETIEVSLHNLVGVTNRKLFVKSAASVKEASLDLHQAIAHLARNRYFLRQDAQERSLKLGKSDPENYPLEPGISDTRRRSIELGISDDGADPGKLRRRASSKFEAGRSRGMSTILSSQELEWNEEIVRLSTSSDDISLNHVPSISRSRSAGSQVKEQRTWKLDDVCVDDLVLYNAFTFVADGCLSAFVRIAVLVLADAEARIANEQAKEE